VVYREIFCTDTLCNTRIVITNINAKHATRKLNQKISRRLCKFPVDFQDFKEEKIISVNFIVFKLYFISLPRTKFLELHIWWRGGATGKAFGLAISRSRVQIVLEAKLPNNLRQVVYTDAHLSPSSITWYRPKGGDALRLRR